MKSNLKFHCMRNNTTNVPSLSWPCRKQLRVNPRHMGGALKGSCPVCDRPCTALRIVVVVALKCGERLAVVGGRKCSAHTTESCGWCSVPWALQHCCCPTQWPSLLSPGAYGSKARHRIVKRHLVMRRRDCTEQLWSSLGRKRHFALTFRPYVFPQHFIVSQFASHHVYECVLFTFCTEAALSFPGGLLQNNTVHVLHVLTIQIVHSLYVLFKSKSKNTKTAETESENTVRPTNEKKTTWPQALSSILQRLMSVPKDPKLKQHHFTYHHDRG